MLTVSLTSIPPRFSGLGPCLESLLAQRCVGDVVLTIPHRYLRFPDEFELPALPRGVTLLRCADIGPACKILPLARQSPADHPILFCDDDWHFGDGWAEGFATAHMAFPNAALAASTFEAKRIGATRGVVAQGFAGVLVRPRMLPDVAYSIPKRFQPVDDIWLSGMLALAKVPIRTLGGLRRFATPSANEAAPLQEAPIRAERNAACAAYLTQKFGVWA